MIAFIVIIVGVALILSAGHYGLRLCGKRGFFIRQNGSIIMDIGLASFRSPTN